jgi:RimJ/RimL family protein N-acetyltransferase
MLPFAVLNPQGQAVGMTTYMNIEATHHRVEIGSTWYRASAQRGPLNTECKRMLLAHAFESLACNAVEFRTHWFNQASRRAIERLGAKLDGVLRAHQIAPNGSLRDTCVYSIVAAEWPAVRSHLDFQLKRPRV